MKPITIILDLGHGKSTPGKRSPELEDGSRFFEWEFTRRLGHAIQNRCHALGIKCILANDGEADPGLSARAAHINDLYAREKKLGRSALMISLHGNAAGAGGWANGRGWEVWTTEGTTNSDKFANIMCEVFPTIFPDQKLRGHKEKNFTVIYKTNCPCVLTENFFYDNKMDLELMQSEEGFEKLVNLHIESIKRYLQ